MKEAEKERRVHRSEGEWWSLLARQQTGGLGVKAFCRSERISAASFYRWRSLLKDGGDSLSRGEVVVGKRAAFVDLGTLRSRDTQQARIEITLDLGDGLTLHLVRR